MINIYTFTPTDYFGSNAYLIECNGEYAIVDPSYDFLLVKKQFPKIASSLKYVLLTHSHFDHILKINSFLPTGCEVVVGQDDLKALSDPYLNCYLGFLGLHDGYFGNATTVSDGDIILLGGEEIRVIGCPGHTPGGVSYKIGNNIFVGDTVFADGGYGRCDLPGGDIEVLEKTIIKLITHENDAVLFPGHGKRTTLKDFILHFN